MGESVGLGYGTLMLRSAKLSWGQKKKKKKKSLQSGFVVTMFANATRGLIHHFATSSRSHC